MAVSHVSPPPAAPRRPPGNISWTFSSSSLNLKWDPVVPLRNESTVTGYKVRKEHGSAIWRNCSPLPSSHRDPQSLARRI